MIRTWLVVCAFAASLQLAAPAAQAGQIDWAGTVTDVFFDDGLGLFTGSGVGAGFSGSFTVPDTCVAPGCDVFDQPTDNETDYGFASASWSVTNGVETASGPLVSINIQDDHALDQDEVDFVNAVLGPGTATLNDLVDVWTASGETADGVYQVEVILGLLGTTLFDNRDYRPAPPALGDVDLAIFTITQTLAPGEQEDPNYDVLGDLTSVPEPSAAALLLLATGALLRRVGG